MYFWKVEVESEIVFGMTVYSKLFRSHVNLAAM